LLCLCWNISQVRLNNNSSWVVIHLSYPSITIEGGQAVGSYGIVDSGK